jgi:quercetin dioxygenase-like cupin family protein
MATPRALSGEAIDVRPFGAAIGEQKTTAILKSEQLELIRVVLQAGKSLPPHHVDGEITVLCLEGELDFCTDAGAIRMTAGSLVHLGRGEQHWLSARTDTSALLTICLPGVRG